MREWLHKKKVTQVEAAEHLGIQQPSLSQMLCARIPFPADKLKILIEWLDPPKEEVVEVFKIFFLKEKKGKTVFKDSPLLRIGVKYEAERRVVEELIEREKNGHVREPHAHYGHTGDPETDHRNEILQLKLEHAEREKELMAELVKQLQEKDELNKKLLGKK